MFFDLKLTDGLVSAQLKSNTYFSEFEGLTKEEAIQELADMVEEERESRLNPTDKIAIELKSINVGEQKKVDLQGYEIDRYRVLVTYVCKKHGIKVSTRKEGPELIVTRLI